MPLVGYIVSFGVSLTTTWLLPPLRNQTRDTRLPVFLLCLFLCDILLGSLQRMLPQSCHRLKSQFPKHTVTDIGMSSCKKNDALRV